MMSITQHFRRLAFALLTGFSLASVAGGVTIVAGALTPACAQVSAEFQAALEPYGEWRRHARWGEVWVPDQRPRDWRPYSVGHWVYTDDWGWFWVSDEDEADWGWVTYHYGRWIHDRGTGWFWVPGEEWGPAWVDWRRGERYVGWAPLAPDDVITEYDNDPTYWVFVEPRYIVEPRVRTYYLPPQQTVLVLRSTVIVNRTFRAGAHIAVNPGVSPAVIAAAARRPIPTFRVAPRVLASTQGVSGAVAVRPQDLRGRGAPRGPNRTPAIAVQRTMTVIQPAASVPKPEPLGKDERGRLGSHPPRAAQGGSVPQQQQQTPAQAPPASSAPVVAPPRTGPRPGQTPVLPPPPVGAPSRPGPPRLAPAPALRQSEPAPQAKPQRPLAPQTPPPAQSGARPQPPAVAHPPPPPRPVAPAVAPPVPPAARPPASPPLAKQPPKPGEKSLEVPK